MDEEELISEPAASWGKSKYDYYFTDYIDKDYPNTITNKEERLAQLEQEEALRIQKKLLSTLDKVNYDIAIDDPGTNNQESEVIEFIEEQNRLILAEKAQRLATREKSRKRVKFDNQPEPLGSDECEFASDDDDGSVGNLGDEKEAEEGGRKRRPINMAIRKNRGLTPYKKKEYRNPRVKHKLKYKKALSKRRHLVKEAQVEYHRYSGESTGIKTSTIRSIKLC